MITISFRDLNISPDSYNHTITASGGFDTANFTINSIVNIDKLLSYIGEKVRVYSDGVLCWYGYIDNITVNLGGITLQTTSLSDLKNKVAVKYNNIITSFAIDQTSIDKYGIQSEVLSSSTKIQIVAERHRDTYLRENSLLKFLPTSIGNSGNSTSITFNLVGFHKKLDYYYKETNTGITTVKNKVETLLVAEPNETFDHYTLDIDENELSVTIEEPDYVKASSLISGMAAMGSENDNYPIYWGFFGDNYFAFKTIPLAEEYTFDSEANILRQNGKIIKPEFIKAGKFLRLTNIVNSGSVFYDRVDLAYINSVNFTYPDSFSISTDKRSKLAQQLSKLGLSGM